MTDSATMRVLSPLLLSSQYRVRIPTSVVLRSAIDGGIVPALGQPLTGYLRVHPDGNGSRVVVKLVNTSDQAAFMEGAWAMVLGRRKANVVHAIAGPAPPQRPHRRKESRPRRSPRLTDRPERGGVSGAAAGSVDVNEAEPE